MSCLKIVETKNRLFWNREIKNDDFIEIRLGLGNRPSLIELSAPEESFTLDDDNLYQAVCALGQKYDLLENVPITVSFKDQIVTALILSSNFSNSFIDSMMLQLMTYHSPLELKLVIITDDENSYHWDYTRYVPHCWSDDKNTRFFGTKQEDFKALSLYLDNEFNLVEKRLQLQYADALAHHPDKVRQRIERLDAIKTSLDQKKPKVKVVRKEEEV